MLAAARVIPFSLSVRTRIEAKNSYGVRRRRSPMSEKDNCAQRLQVKGITSTTTFPTLITEWSIHNPKYVPGFQVICG